MERRGFYGGRHGTPPLLTTHPVCSERSEGHMHCWCHVHKRRPCWPRLQVLLRICHGKRSVTRESLCSVAK